MYPRYFGLKEPSFAITPDPQYLYLSRQHREALAHLLYGAGQGGGFVLLTGEVGTGKTTVCRAFLEQVPDDVDVALVLNPAMTAVELMRAICHEFGVDVQEQEPSVKILVDRLNTYLLDAHGRGRHPVLIIDEAQNLRPKVLEQIRLLTNLETTKQKLLQIFLIGQPELRKLLSSVDLRQLNQRVTARFHLQPLGPAETAAYVEHRIAIAGVDRPLFTRAALRRVYRCSGGVPRLINLICDRALLGTAASRQLQVTPTIVKRAAREVRGSGQPIVTGIGRALAIAMSLLLAIGLGVWIGVSGLANDGLVSLRTLAGMPWSGQQPAAVAAAVQDSPPSASAPSPAFTSPAMPTIGAALLPDDAQDAAPGERSSDRADPASASAPLTTTDTEPLATPEIVAPPDGMAEDQQITAADPADPADPDSPADPADPDDIETATSQTASAPNAAPSSRPPSLRLTKSQVPSDLANLADADLPGVLLSEPAAIAALVAAWGMSPPAGADVSCQSVRGLDLECERNDGRWSELRLFDRPVALRLKSADGRNDGYVVISALDEEFATIDNGNGAARAAIAALDERWSGDYLMLWRPPRPGVRFISRKSWGEVVQWLRTQLAQLPEAEVTNTDSPVYDEALVRAVQRFQRGQGLRPDGIAGPRTLILLNNLVAESSLNRFSQSP